MDCIAAMGNFIYIIIAYSPGRGWVLKKFSLPKFETGHFQIVEWGCNARVSCQFWGQKRAPWLDLLLEHIANVYRTIENIQSIHLT